MKFVFSSEGWQIGKQGAAKPNVSPLVYPVTVRTSARSHSVHSAHSVQSHVMYTIKSQSYANIYSTYTELTELCNFVPIIVERPENLTKPTVDIKQAKKSFPQLSRLQYS